MTKNLLKNMMLLLMILSVLFMTSCAESDFNNKLASKNKEKLNLIYKHRPRANNFNCVSVYQEQVAWVVSTKPEGVTNQIVSLNIPTNKEKVVYTNQESGVQTDELILKSSREVIYCNWRKDAQDYYWEINVLNIDSKKVKKIASSNDRNSTVALPRLYSDGRYLSWLEINRKEKTFDYTLYVYNFTSKALKAIASFNQIYNPHEFYKIKNGFISWIDTKDSKNKLYIYDLNKDSLVDSFEVGLKARGPISNGNGAVWAEGEHMVEGTLYYKNLTNKNKINICNNIGNFDWTGNIIVYEKKDQSIETYNINSKAKTTLTKNDDKGRLPSVNKNWILWYHDMPGQDNSFVLYPVNKVSKL